MLRSSALTGPAIKPIINTANTNNFTIELPPITRNPAPWPLHWPPNHRQNYSKKRAIFRKKMFRENGVVDRSKARWLFLHAYIVTHWSASWK